MKESITICVYGTLKKGDVRVKVMPKTGEQYRFQNILVEAGYDAHLFTLSPEEIEEGIRKEQ